MIRLTYEQKEENRKLRHQIIDEIMEIQDAKSLNAVRLIAKVNKEKEWTNHVLSLEEAIGLIDMKMIGKLYRLFSEDEENYLVKKQVTELCKDAIDQYVRTGGSITDIAEDIA